MARRSSGRSRSWRRPGILVPLVLLVAAATVLGLLLAGRVWLPGGTDVGAPGARAAPSAAALLVPTPSPVLTATSGSTPSAAGVATALEAAVADPGLGGSVGVSVVDAVTGAALLDQGGAAGRTPASTLKLLTGAAALRALGPSARLVTRVVLAGPAVLVLVGGGDATLVSGPTPAGRWPQRASLRELASSTVAALRRGSPVPAAGAAAASSGPPAAVEVRVDDSLFAGATSSPGWEASYLASGVVAPVQALSVDAGRTAPTRSSPAASHRVADPAVAAGQRFAALLRAAGVPVTGGVTRAIAPIEAHELARVESPTVATLVELDLETSDDDLAEALAHVAGSSATRAGSFVSGAAATLGTLKSLGVPTFGVRLLDGSGLSRADAVPPRTLTALLSLASSPAHPELRALLTGLPVAGWSGTLADRFTSPAAPGAGNLALGEGRVRAKTGTLTGASALAGTVLDVDGRLLAFAVLADAVPSGAGTLQARAALDRFAGKLAACGCRPAVSSAGPPAVSSAGPPAVSSAGPPAVSAVPSSP